MLFWQIIIGRIWEAVANHCKYRNEESNVDVVIVDVHDPSS